jgi:SAM-dependent methyltransferase
LHPIVLLTPLRRARIKRTAARLGVLDVLYRTRLAWLNLRAADEPAASGVRPLPPPRLRTLVAGTPDPEVFVRSGELSADAVRSAVAAVGGRADRVLDFGCGCGRTIRHWPESVSLDGCDPNAELIAWCKENLEFARFSVSPRVPPLEFETGSFDLVYAISVFTHLAVPTQRAWMEDLARLLKPGGVLVITTHGDTLAATALTARDRAAYDAGDIVVTYPGAEGENLCAAYHPAGSVGSLTASLSHELHLPRALEAHDMHVLVRPGRPA